MMRRLRERGVVLISVLILVALAAVVAASVFFDTGLMARRAANSFGMEEALQLGQGAEALAAYVLGDDTNQTDTPNDTWATETDPYEVTPDISLTARLFDLQGRFNINTLMALNGTHDQNAMKVYKRLLELLGIDATIADYTMDWLDADLQPEPQGGEDGLYTSEMPPHLTANFAVTSTSELLQLPGMTPEVYAKLKPHISALPPSVRTINVCMADGYVLDALYALDANDPSHVEYSALPLEEIKKLRSSDECYPRRATLIADVPTMTSMISERTNWFRLQTLVRVGTAQFDLYSLMYRTGRQARAVARSLGTE
jgi:general secretion pathway protein K